MGKNAWGDIVRDGFICSYGRFRTERGGLERTEGSNLRAMFLPNLSPEGRRILARDGETFVRSQLLHYGVTYRENEFSGNGTLLMKKVLQAGKCDRVPDHLTTLREEMHAEWLDTLSPKEVSDHPEFAMDKYFLTAGRPDKTKASTPVGIPLDRSSSYRSGNLRRAAEKVDGLYSATGRGPKTQTIFMGWDEEAVLQAASGHCDKEQMEVQAAEKQREAERDELHHEYLKSLKGKGTPKTYSPVGQYIVDCKDIEDGWDDVGDLTLDIFESDTDGIFQASFDFGILEGVILICTGEGKLIEYVSTLDSENELGSEESDDEHAESLKSEDVEDDEEEAESDIEEKGKGANQGSRMGGKKRTSQASLPRNQPRKKAKAVASPSLQYFIRLRCSETGEGEIYPTPEEGTIRFNNKTMAAFSGKVDMPCVGSNIPFSARKVSNLPSSHKKMWSDYSDSTYEYARVNRWG